jgi:hypothetical protein
MPHTCKSDFWGDGADLLTLWLDYLDAQLDPLGPPGTGSVRFLTLETYASLCALHAAIEVASGYSGNPPKPHIGGAGFDPGVEAEFRQVVQVLTALLVADQYDNTKQNPHDLVVPLGQGWMWTPANSNNPEAGAIERLVGPAGAPPTQLNLTLDRKKSVLGRIKNSLGS